MMRSLSSAVAGLRTHQTKMDVIGNNIANVNTYGYKANRAVFADIYYQNLSRGSGPVTTTGGTNPTQIGYGSAIATIDVLHGQAGAASTDRPMDVYITGEGFLTTQDAMGNYMYTRLGSLGFDAAGNLVDGGGNFIMGFPQNADGTPNISADGTVTADELQPIMVNPDLLQELTDITISEGGEIIGILPGNTRVTLGTAMKNWMGIPTVPEDSNLQGQVTLKVGALPTPGMFDAAVSDEVPTASLNGLIEDVEFGDLSIAPNSSMTITTTPSGRMTCKVDIIDNEGVRSNGIIAEGTWENGKIVLKYEGDTLMTLTVAEDAVFPDTSGSTPNDPIVDDLFYDTAETIPMYEFIPANTKALLDPITGNPIPIYQMSAPNNATLDLDAAGKPVPLYWSAGGTVLTDDVTAADGYAAGTPARAYYTEDGTSGGDVVTGPGATADGIPMYRMKDGTGATVALNVTYQQLNGYASGTATSAGNFAGNTGVSGAADTDSGIAKYYTTDPDAKLKVDADGPIQATKSTPVASDPHAFVIDDVGDLQFILSTFDKGGNVRMSGDAAGNPGEQPISSLNTVVNNGVTQYEVTLGDATFYFSPYSRENGVDGLPNTADDVVTGMQNYMGVIGRVGMSEGEKINIGCIAIAKFSNQAGLEQIGNTQYMSSLNTGEVTYNKPGTNNVGGLSANYLEQSNVDISKEFTDMITTQRGFQANTRIVTVSDEMLNELVNLKR